MSVMLSKLENGITVITDTMKDVESVSLGMWVNAGSRNEDERLGGISHLLEHMAFKSTKNRSTKEISEQIEDVGGFLNAYTSRENTAYYAKVLKEDVALATDIISDILLNSLFDKEELAREKDVIIQEINRSYDTPDDYVYDVFQEAIYPNHSFGRPILGTVEKLQSFSSEDLFDYVAKQYLPSRMIFSAAGNVEHSRMLDLVQEKFSSLSPAVPSEISKPLYVGAEKIEKRDIEQAHIILGFDAFPIATDDALAANLLGVILGGVSSSRLSQEIREERGLVYTVYASTIAYQDVGNFIIYAGTGGDKLQELSSVVVDEIAKITRSISDDEIKRAKNCIRASLLMKQESTYARAESNASLLLNWGKVLSMQEILAKIEAINENNLLDVASKVFSSPMSMTILGDVKSVPQKNELEEKLGIALTRK